MKGLVRLALIGCLLPCSAFAAPPRLAAPVPAGISTRLPGAGYDPQNSFARILRGELPATKVYEDAHVLAFLSVNQEVAGHVLVISKTSKARDILEIAPADLDRIMRVAQRIARAERVALGADGIEIVQNNGATAGQTVFQFHVHVIPHWGNGGPIGLPMDATGRLDRSALASRLAAAMH